MEHRICLAAIAALATSPVLVAPAPASAESGTSRCVSGGEFSHVRAGTVRRDLESRWEVRGLARWDNERSTPGYDVYIYPACNKRATVSVAILRPGRTWLWREWKYDYS